MVHIILIHLSTFTAKTASAINTPPFSYFKSDLVSFVWYEHLEEAETKGFLLQGCLCGFWISIFYEGQG